MRPTLNQFLVNLDDEELCHAFTMMVLDPNYVEDDFSYMCMDICEYHSNYDKLSHAQRHTLRTHMYKHRVAAESAIFSQTTNHLRIV